MQEMRELARLLIKFRETAREEGMECELGMEEMLSCVRLPILRQAIDELAREKDDQEKYGQKLGMNNILMRTIKSMKGMYAETMEDEKAAELDSCHDSYKFRAHELFASARYRAVAQSMNKACRPAGNIHCTVCKMRNTWECCKKILYKHTRTVTGIKLICRQ